MSDLKINDENELIISNGDLVLTTEDNDAIPQHLRQRLRVLKGEWFLDRTIGLPYFDLIMEKNPSSKLVAAVFKKTILDTPGVLKLNSFDLSFDRINRKVSVSFEATISNGTVINFEDNI